MDTMTDGVEKVTEARAREMRRRYPELLRARDVEAIAFEFGLTMYAVRLLMEGPAAPLRRHQLGPPGARGHYKREELLTILLKAG